MTIGVTRTTKSLPTTAHAGLGRAAHEPLEEDSRHGGADFGALLARAASHPATRSVHAEPSAIHGAQAGSKRPGADHAAESRTTSPSHRTTVARHASDARAEKRHNESARRTEPNRGGGTNEHAEGTTARHLHERAAPAQPTPERQEAQGEPTSARTTESHRVEGDDAGEASGTGGQGQRAESSEIHDADDAGTLLAARLASARLPGAGEAVVALRTAAMLGHVANPLSATTSRADANMHPVAEDGTARDRGVRGNGVRGAHRQAHAGGDVEENDPAAASEVGVEGWQEGQEQGLHAKAGGNGKADTQPSQGARSNTVPAQTRGAEQSNGTAAVGGGAAVPASAAGAEGVKSSAAAPSQGARAEGASAATALVGRTPGGARTGHGGPQHERAAGMERQLDELFRTRRQDAATTAVNRMTLRHGAEGSVDLGDLGKVRVRARTVDGEVDIDIRAESQDTTAVLQSTSAVLEAELRKESLDVRQLGIEQEESDATLDERDTADRDGRRESDARGEQEPTPDAETDFETSVRFVL